MIFYNLYCFRSERLCLEFRPRNETKLSQLNCKEMRFPLCKLNQEKDVCLANYQRFTHQITDECEHKRKFFIFLCSNLSCTGIGNACTDNIE